MEKARECEPMFSDVYSRHLMAIVGSKTRLEREGYERGLQVVESYIVDF